MGRSNGYRPKAAVKEEVLALRERLAQCTGSQWVKAGMLMDQITGLLGHNGGPMGAKINPRACKVCDMFGHTRQWCPVLKRRDEAAADRMLEEDRKYAAQFENVTPPPPYDPRTCGQARTFDELGMPFTISLSGTGPIVGVPGEQHEGLWTFDENKCVIKRRGHGRDDVGVRPK